MPKLNREQSLQLLHDLEISSLAEITEDWLASFLGKLNDPIKMAAWNTVLDILKEFDPVNFAKLNAFAAQNRGMLLEYQGYERWLTTLGPHTFTGDFSWFHKDEWDWYWPATLNQRAGRRLDLEDITYLAIWGRGLGKSSNAEWLAIAEGCLVGKGFVLYVCGTAEQSEAHVEAIRDRLETEGAISQMYPGMKKPSGKGGFVGEHRQYGWRQDYLMTANGWAIRPVGLDKAIRGWKRGDSRVSLIIFDDIDDDDDSPEVIAKKERRIAKKILPMGTARTKVVFAQNLIHSNSVLNRIHTRQTDILALRRGDVPVKAFDEITIEHEQTPRGPRWLIKKGVPTWPHIDMAECQSFLDRSGRDAFLAEYQHDFSGEQNDRVLPEYDDRVLRLHVITWSQYEAMYQQRRIPSDWPCDAGLDIGYTTGHKSAWTFLTKAPMWVTLAGTIFRYRGRTFTGVGIDEQAVSVRRDMWPQENIQREFMSHEKLGERMVLNTKHGWHFHPCESAKTAGIPQWRHYLVCDRTKPHPFHRDEKMPDGLWKLGQPSWFDIVDDDQLVGPRDDRGLKTHRDQAYNWKMRKVEETKSGMTVEQPMKADEDSCFVSGTLITTKRGDVSIEEVTEKDVVLTRQGWYNVSASGLTSGEAETWELILSNGNRLRGTSQHPIWVAGYGWKPLSELKAGERLLSLTECDSTVTQTQNIGRIGRISSPMFTRFVRVLALSMLSYGRRSMAQFQRATRYTTKTIGRSTMPIQTLNFSPVPNIVATTAITCRLNSRPECGPILLVSRNWLRSGIVVQKGESGIKSTPKNQDLQCAPKLTSSALIQNARKLLWGDPFGINIAARFVSSVIKAGWFWLRDNAQSVKRTIKQELNLEIEGFAGVSVVSVKLHSFAPVYNLSVESLPEYFANGVLVHNCDATRALTAGTAFGPADQPMNQTQRINAAIPAGYHRNELAQRTDIDPARAAMTAEIAEFLAAKSVKKPTRLFDSHGQPLR